MQDKGSVLIKERDVNRHKYFEQLLFNRQDGHWTIRLLLSSYTFMNNGAAGYPDGLSDCKNCKGAKCTSCSKSMPFSQAYDDSSCGYDCVKNGQWQEGVYTRVHRDQDIIRAMRGWMGLGTNEHVTALGLAPHCANNAQTLVSQ